MRKSIKKKKWILAGAAGAAAVILAVIGLSAGGISAETADVDTGEVIQLIKETGTVESESVVTIASKFSGEIKGLTVSEGQEVKVGELLIAGGGTAAQMDIKSLQAELSGLQIQYSRAMELAEKNRALYEQGALSLEEYNQSSTAAKELSSRIAALDYSIKSYAESSDASGITSPIDGFITGVFVQEGETVSAGTPLLEISNLDDIYVKASLIAEDADRIKPGDPARVFNEDAQYSDDHCSVRKIHMKAREEVSELGILQKRVTVEIGCGSPASLRLGSDVDVEITADKRENVTRIDRRAAFEKERKKYVFAVKDGRAVLREIQTGLEGEDYVEIIKGLSPGEKVILSPDDAIEEGARIKEAK